MGDGWELCPLTRYRTFLDLSTGNVPMALEDTIVSTGMAAYLPP